MRKLTPKEVEIISRILKDDEKLLNYFDRSKGELLVEEMNDGGMGSLLFEAKDKSKKRRFGERVGQIQLKDQDDTPVMAYLNLDSEGEFFELDVWKVDYSPVEDIVLD